MACHTTLSNCVNQNLHLLLYQSCIHVFNRGWYLPEWHNYFCFASAYNITYINIVLPFIYSFCLVFLWHYAIFMTLCIRSKLIKRKGNRNLTTCPEHRFWLQQDLFCTLHAIAMSFFFPLYFLSYVEIAFGFCSINVFNTCMPVAVNWLAWELKLIQWNYWGA